MDFLAQQQAAFPDLAARYQALKDLHVRKCVRRPRSAP
jgi:hypothetical protein